MAVRVFVLFLEFQAEAASLLKPDLAAIFIWQKFHTFGIL